MPDSRHLVSRNRISRGEWAKKPVRKRRKERPAIGAARQIVVKRLHLRGRDLGRGDGNGRQTIVVTITCQDGTALKKAIDRWLLSLHVLVQNDQ